MEGAPYGWPTSAVIAFDLKGADLNSPSRILLFNPKADREIDSRQALIRVNTYLQRPARMRAGDRGAGGRIFSGSAWRTGSRRAAVAAHRAAFDLLIRNPGASAGSSGGVPAALWLGPLSFLAVLAVFDGRLAALTASILAGLVFLVLAGFRLRRHVSRPAQRPARACAAMRFPQLRVIAALHREVGSVGGAD